MAVFQVADALVAGRVFAEENHILFVFPTDGARAQTRADRFPQFIHVYISRERRADIFRPRPKLYEFCLLLGKNAVGLRGGVLSSVLYQDHCHFV